MQNFPTVYYPKMVFEENFLRLTVTVTFQKKMSTSKTWIFLSFFHSISYNNVVVAKQVFFHPHF